MATKFLEPGGDATFNAQITTAGGFWGASLNSPATATDFVHGTHIKSLKYRSGFADQLETTANSCVDAGTRISIYFYLNALPAANATIFQTLAAGVEINVKLTNTGVLRLYASGGGQIGTDGEILSTGKWYRLSLAYTVTNATTNQFRLFKDGVVTISATNGTVNNTTATKCRVGNIDGDSTLDIRSSDHYIDDSSSLTDTGDIWVTAKRPFANGSLNEFTTQIGAGGSSYGSGHSPQVNERPLSTTNGWSVINAGSIKTEEYTIEGKVVGDINIGGDSIVDYMGWVYASSVTSETAKIIVNNVQSNISLTSSAAMFTAAAGSTIYPAGNTDIGVATDTTVTTVGLYECGIIVAFKMPAGIFGNYSPYIKSGNMSRNERAT